MRQAERAASSPDDANVSSAPPSHDAVEASHSPQGRRRWRGWKREMGYRVVAFFLALCLYALSLGPLYWQWYESRYVGGSAFLAAFYEPLIRACNAIPLLSRFMGWYVLLWI